MALRNLSAQNTPSTPANILLVDDNAYGLAARKCVLEELGHRITTASCGAEALEHFVAAKFDLVVTDYKMPPMDGTELIQRLRCLVPGLAVIMVSGFTDHLGMDEKSTGADVVIQKSANEVTHLVRAVNRLLKRKPGSGQTGSVQSGTAVKAPKKPMGSSGGSAQVESSQTASGTAGAVRPKTKNS